MLKHPKDESNELSYDGAGPRGLLEVVETWLRRGNTADIVPKHLSFSPSSRVKTSYLSIWARRIQTLIPLPFGVERA